MLAKGLADEASPVASSPCVPSTNSSLPAVVKTYVRSSGNVAPPWLTMPVVTATWIAVTDASGTAAVNRTVAPSAKTVSVPTTVDPSPSVTLRDWEVTVAGRIGSLNWTTIGAVREALGVPGGGERFTMPNGTSGASMRVNDAWCRAPAGVFTRRRTGPGGAVAAIEMETAI